MASPAYPDAWFVMIAIGTAKGMIIIINDYCHQCRRNALQMLIRGDNKLV